MIIPKGGSPIFRQVYAQMAYTSDISSIVISTDLTPSLTVSLCTRADSEWVSNLPRLSAGRWARMLWTTFILVSTWQGLFGSEFRIWYLISAIFFLRQVMFLVSLSHSWATNMSSELSLCLVKRSAARACVRSSMLCDLIQRIETPLLLMTSTYHPRQLEPQNRVDYWEVLCAVPPAWKFAAWPGKLARRQHGGLVCITSWDREERERVIFNASIARL